MRDTPEYAFFFFFVCCRSQEMAAIIDDSNNAYHARDKAQSEMMALRQQVPFSAFRCMWLDALCFVNTGCDGKEKEVAAQRYFGVFCGIHFVGSAECNGECNGEGGSVLGKTSGDALFCATTAVYCCVLSRTADADHACCNRRRRMAIVFVHDVYTRHPQADKDRAEFDVEWKELGKLIAQDRKLRESLRQRQLDRNRDLRCACFYNCTVYHYFCGLQAVVPNGLRPARKIEIIGVSSPQL